MSYRLTYIAQHLKATATNACGRLLRVDDGTGYQIFSYDKLGVSSYSRFVFQCLQAAALGIGCGFSQPNDFCPKNRRALA